jgi:hypothetical protein
MLLNYVSVVRRIGLFDKKCKSIAKLPLPDDFKMSRNENAIGKWFQLFR